MRERSWRKPELVVLVRSGPEEVVLTACKDADMTGQEPNNAFALCWTAQECAHCMVWGRRDVARHTTGRVCLVSGYVRRVTRPEKPLGARLGRLDIELTERCDNDCVHCCINLPAGDSAARAREMTTREVEGLLTEAAGLGCLQVRFTGGEPLLRPDLEELYLFARRLGLKVLLFTNARRITPAFADLLARVPPLVSVEVTVYGMHAASYEAVSRVPGSFAQFRRGVDLLLERGVPFVVKAALLPPNRAEMDELEAWAETIPWMTKPPGYAMCFDLRNRRDDPARNRLIESLRVTPEERVAVLTRDPDRYRKGMEEFAGKFMGAPGDLLFRCGAGHGLSVDAYGRAQPCMGVRTPELTVDLVGRDGGGPASLAAALERFESLKDVRAQDPEYLRRCARCFLKGLCEQCPAKSWSEHGTLDTPVEYLCEVAHAQARRLGWLRAGERAWEVGRRCDDV
jgi:radical SAM protein with 4Fe4S-binding SPASM domain